MEKLFKPEPFSDETMTDRLSVQRASNGFIIRVWDAESVAAGTRIVSDLDELLAAIKVEFTP